MRHAQSRLGDNFSTVENQIQVKCSRCTGVRTFATSVPFDVLERREQCGRRERRDANRGTIEEVRLRSDADWGGLVPRRDLDIGKHDVEALNRELQVGPAVADITSESDRDSIQPSVCREPCRGVR